ncbi:hypothetical protein B0H10DRAFT_888496 [Mycena sp. CBHHK59/15]|nr:hypothetical protein B0H10DRAFT_888496 [Mycena sp. CBHHK59/15]
MSSITNPCLEANPDISGRGVRIAFYLQTLALVFLAGRALDEALSSVWTLIGTSFGLTVSALVTAVQNELPLYQAIIVTDLVWLAQYAIFMALATYNRHPHGSRTVQYAAVGQTYISMASILYLWTRASSLEIDAHRGRTVFVILFASSSATGVGRTVALVMISCMVVIYSLLAFRFLSPFSSARSLLGHPENIQEPHEEQLAMTTIPSPAPDVEKDAAHAAGSRPPPALPFDPHLFTLTCFFGIPYVITVTCTELQINRNRLCAENSFWGFGQILAMTVTVVPVFITVRAFRKYGLKQKPRAPQEGSDVATV